MCGYTVLYLWFSGHRFASLHTLPLSIHVDQNESVVYNKVEAQIEQKWYMFPLPDNNGCHMGLKCPVAVRKGGSTHSEIQKLLIPFFAPKVS